MFGKRKTRPESLSEVFNQFAQQAVVDFPELKGRFVIFDVRSRMYAGDIDLSKTGFSSQAILERHLMSLRKATDGEYAYATKSGGVNVISFNQAMPVSGNYAEDVKYTLAHELGHCVVSEAISIHRNFNECAADIFAILKQGRCFGRRDEYLDLLARWRTRKAVLEQGSDHLTNIALYKLAETKSTITFRKISPQKMTALSEQIARESAVSGYAINSLFDKALGARRSMPFGELLQSLANLLCGDVSAEEFRLGMAVIKPYFHSINGHPAPPELSGRNWSKMCRNLQEKERKLVVATKRAQKKSRSSSSPAP
jgi:hypothetical protein